LIAAAAPRTLPSVTAPGDRLRLLLLAEPGSSHTLRWARALADRGVEVQVFGLGAHDPALYPARANLRVESVGLAPELVGGAEGRIDKLRYLGALPRLRRLVRSFAPHVLHAHYATSYGLLGALAAFHPYVLSVWGADVYEFPRRSPLHRAVLRFNLRRADRILSTSHVMARETRRYTRAPVTVTPFGVDLERFRPGSGASLFAPDDLVVGTVKTLDEKYGVEYLVRAFRLIKDRHPDLPLKLLVVGGGPLLARLQALARDLGLADCARFTGPVPHDEVPRYHAMLTVPVFASVADSESFGVAVVEASACAKAVVVSRVGGLPEVVEDGVTGVVVPPRDPEATAAAIERLVTDPALRERLGRAGRERVRRRYDWNDNVARMLRVYGEVRGASGNGGDR
jgi:glycosyltransferase involved in cell wall biosynthesis